MDATLDAGTNVQVTLLPELEPDQRIWMLERSTLYWLYKFPATRVEYPVGCRVLSEAGPRKVYDGKAEEPPGRNGSQVELSFTVPPVNEAVAIGIL